MEKEWDFTALDEILLHYKDREGSLIPILQQAQTEYGYLASEILSYIAEKTGIKPSKIMGVATFYAQFRLQPVGKNLIMICQGTACHVNGSAKIYEAICRELSIQEGETTPDGLFTIKNVACLGCCSLSPVMMINGDTYGSLTPENTIDIINEIKERSQKEAD